MATWLIGGGWWALAAAVAVYAVMLASWMMATGERLTLSGFAIPAKVTPS